jgi:hypothetical protein
MNTAIETTTKASKQKSKINKEFDNAHEAYRFIKNHPEFNYFEKFLLGKRVERQRKIHVKESGGQLYHDRNGYWHVVYPEHNPCIQENFHFIYVKVDKYGKVNKNSEKNLFTECWLEIGQIKWELHHESHTGPEIKTLYHDYEIDTGGATFEEALIRMANKIARKYGLDQVKD